MSDNIESFIAAVEKSGRNFSRRVHAALGTQTYDGADAIERMRAILGFHDDCANCERDGNPGALQPGDIVGVSRGWYDHYGIYAGQDSVVHYWSPTSNLVASHVEHTSMADFLRGESRHFVLRFGDENVGRHQARLYSATETLDRARSRLGEHLYDIESNNCEHFVFWCKTGSANSHQIRHLRKLLTLQQSTFAGRPIA